MTDAAVSPSARNGTTGASTNGERMFSGEQFRADVQRALVLAAKDAHLEAYLAGQGVAYDRDGVFGIYRPEPEMYEDLLPPDFDRSSVPPQFEDEETFPDWPSSLPQEYLDGLKALANCS